jgi:predicted nucleic acid-binding protein
VIFLDSNIPMYLVGAHPRYRAESRHMLEGAIANGDRLVTNAEVLQEILHRYGAIKRLDAIQPAFDALLGVVDEVFPVTDLDVDRAKTILLGSAGARSARDAIHLATMERHRVSRIMTFDAGFDGYPGVTRLAPGT